MKGRIGGRGEKEVMSNHWLGFCFPFLPHAWDIKKNVRMCRRARRCEGGESERAWPIESRVFSGSKVSLQSLLMQSPWEPINLSAAAISIRRGHTLRHTLGLVPTHTHTHNKAFIQFICIGIYAQYKQTPCLMLFYYAFLCSHLSSVLKS